MGTIHSQIKNFVGTPVSVTAKGPLTLEGSILDVKLDYLIFKDNSGACYFIPIAAIKEINKNAKKHLPIISEPSAINDMTFCGLLNSLKQNWLYVKRAGIDHLEGILINVNSDHAIFINHESIYIIPIDEIVGLQVVKGEIDTESQTERTSGNGENQQSSEKNQQSNEKKQQDDKEDSKGKESNKDRTSENKIVKCEMKNPSTKKSTKEKTQKCCPAYFNYNFESLTSINSLFHEWIGDDLFTYAETQALLSYSDNDSLFNDPLTF